MRSARFVRYAVICCSLNMLVPARAATIVHGPYLQLPSQTSMTVRWRTDTSHTGTVFYGISSTNLTLSKAEATSSVDHEVVLTGLQPDTTYYYSIHSGTNVLAGDDTYRFRTVPNADTAEPMRIWVLGDPGTGTTDAQAVYSAYLGYTGTNRTDLLLALGDNAYSSGTDAEFHDKFFTIYPEILRTAPAFPAFGNHDGASADSATQSGPYYDLFSLPTAGESGGTPSGTEAYYSFDYGNAHFICLDSSESSRATNGSMHAWVEQDLAACTSTWIIAFWHHPPYTKGSHNSDTETPLVQMRENFIPLLEQYGTDLVLCGHSHSYECSNLMDGHYGLSASYDFNFHALNQGNGQEAGDGVYMKPSTIKAEHSGTVYVVAGSSGSVSGSVIGVHPAMETSIRQMGSVVLDITGNRLDMVFLNKTGVILDSFSIVKGEGDYDGDGMPDLWEQDTFRINVEPTGNVDNDPQDNVSEYIAGTDPINPQSYFQITNSLHDGTGFIVQWESISGRAYAIHWSEALTNAFSVIQTNILYPQSSYTDAVHSADSAGFYSIEVQLQ